MEENKIPQIVILGTVLRHVIWFTYNVFKFIFIYRHPLIIIFNFLILSNYFNSFKILQVFHLIFPINYVFFNNCLVFFAEIVKWFELINEIWIHHAMTLINHVFLNVFKIFERFLFYIRTKNAFLLFEYLLSENFNYVLFIDTVVVFYYEKTVS